MSELLKVNYYRLGVLLDLDCPRSEIILDQVVCRSAFMRLYLPHSLLFLAEVVSNTVLSLRIEFSLFFVEKTVKKINVRECHKSSC